MFILYTQLFGYTMNEPCLFAWLSPLSRLCNLVTSTTTTTFEFKGNFSLQHSVSTTWLWEIRLSCWQVVLYVPLIFEPWRGRQDIFSEVPKRITIKSQLMSRVGSQQEFDYIASLWSWKEEDRKAKTCFFNACEENY